MAVTDAYFTKQEYLDAIKKPISTATEDAVIERGRFSVSRYLEKVTNSFFTQDAAVVARSIRANNERYLELAFDGCPGIATTTGFICVVDGHTLDNVTDLVFLPLNADKGPIAKPFEEIELLPAAQVGSFYSTTGFITVTAKWGWPSVPDIVKDTAIELLSIWQGESPRSTGRMNELDQVVSMSPIAEQLVNRFIKAMRRPVVA